MFPYYFTPAVGILQPRPPEIRCPPIQARHARFVYFMIAINYPQIIH